MSDDNYVEDDFELGDVESYKSEPLQKFSHQALVMSAMMKVQAIRSQELTEGRNFLHTDTKTGKKTIVFKEDLREAYFGAMSILIQLMRCDYDDEAKKEIPALITGMDEKRKSLLLEQFLVWKKASEQEKQMILQECGVITATAFNKKLPHYDEYVKEKIECYDQIYGELNCLTERLGFYTAEEVTG